jgi:hypothetical protein
MTRSNDQEFEEGEREEPSVDTQSNDLGILLRNQTASLEDRVADLVRVSFDVLDLKHACDVVRGCPAHADHVHLSGKQASLLTWPFSQDGPIAGWLRFVVRFAPPELGFCTCEWCAHAKPEP